MKPGQVLDPTTMRGEEETLVLRSMARLGQRVEEPSPAVVDDHQGEIDVAIVDEAIAVVEHRDVPAHRKSSPTLPCHAEGG